jgi:hypothetical protein
MSATAYELIGQMINPQPVQRAAAAPRVQVLPSEGVHELIGRIISAPGASRGVVAASEAQIVEAVPVAG